MDNLELALDPLSRDKIIEKARREGWGIEFSDVSNPYAAFETFE